MDVIVGIVLSIGALEDWRTKQISLWFPLIGMVAGVVVRAMEASLGTADFWLGMLIGLCALAIAALSGGQIGSGDGLVLTVCGICLGWRRVLTLLFCSMLLFLIVGVGGILTKRWTGRQSIAFVPFIWSAFLIECLSKAI
ncbi:MAG: prepilin peptidase [Lachnospiraceae bacterium]|nr:prepilin peptidase [Lachnospiraceae bacterium]